MGGCVCVAGSVGLKEKGGQNAVWMKGGWIGQQNERVWMAEAEAEAVKRAGERVKEHLEKGI